MKEFLYPLAFLVCFVLALLAMVRKPKKTSVPLTESQKRYIANICAVYILRQKAISIQSVKCITEKEQAEIISYLLIAASNIQRGAPDLKSIEEIVKYVRENIKY